jgi:hypothetical protein
MKRTTNYRWIWKKNNGPIPKDENGISYQIHHIDGNHNNNHLSNLVCVSLDEHIEIHRKQNDWPSVAFLEQMRGKNITGWTHSDETKKRLSKLNRIGTIGMKGKRHSDDTKRKMSDAKIGIVTSDETKQKQREAKLKNPTNYWLGKSRKGMMVNHPTLTCPYCGKIGKGESAMNKWHFDNCKLKNK